MKTIIFCSFLALGVGFIAFNNSDNDNMPNEANRLKPTNKEMKVAAKEVEQHMDSVQFIAGDN